MTTAEILEAAARLVERGMCRGAFARDDFGFEVPFTSPAAAYFCGEGAILASGGCEVVGLRAARAMSPSVVAAGVAVTKEAKARGFESLAAFNDASPPWAVASLLRVAKATA